jgi:hypothetical protein
MSIYATQWALRFPRRCDFHIGCEWVTVLAQAVPAHVAAGGGYRTLLPPYPDAVANDLWAIVFVVEGAAKGTKRSSQEYVAPLLALSGKEYAAMPFGVLHARLCDSLRGDRPRLAAEVVIVLDTHTIVSGCCGGARRVNCSTQHGRRGAYCFSGASLRQIADPTSVADAQHDPNFARRASDAAHDRARSKYPRLASAHACRAGAPMGAGADRGGREEPLGPPRRRHCGQGPPPLMRNGGAEDLRRGGRVKIFGSPRVDAGRPWRPGFMARSGCSKASPARPGDEARDERPRTRSLDPPLRGDPWKARLPD